MSVAALMVDPVHATVSLPPSSIAERESGGREADVAGYLVDGKWLVFIAHYRERRPNKL